MKRFPIKFLIENYYLFFTLSSISESVLSLIVMSQEDVLVEICRRVRNGARDPEAINLLQEIRDSSDLFDANMAHRALSYVDVKGN